MKVCSKCDREKQLDEFHKDKSRKLGKSLYCKMCTSLRVRNVNKTKKFLISQIYSGQKYNSKVRGDNPPIYSRAELFEFAIKSKVFNDLYNRWVGSNYNKWLTPSFDRKNDYKGYSFGNFNKWMTWVENKDKYHNDAINGINNKNSKAVIMYDLNGGFVNEFHSLASAYRSTGISDKYISRCCNGHQHTTHNRIFKFKNFK